VAVPNNNAPAFALENVYSQGSDNMGPSHNQQVYALAPISNTNKTDVCAVGFYCTWDGGRHAYVLRRHFFASDATFNRLSGKGLPAAGGPIAASAIFAPSSPATSPALDEDIAAYVWDLKIVPYDYSSGNLAQNTTYPITYRGTLPQFVEVSFKAISPQAAVSVTAANPAPSVWFDATSTIYKNQILPVMQQFDTRIRLANAVRP
jgi:hypothetical protein